MIIWSMSIRLLLDCTSEIIKLFNSNYLFWLLSGAISILIAITVIKSGAVMGPIGHTNPTELVATGLISTNHMITSTILLNSRFALWAFFRIGMDPIVCLTFCGFSHVQKVSNFFRMLKPSLSSSHFFFHIFKSSHFTGSCHFSPQLEHRVWSQRHLTSSPTLWSCMPILSTTSQSGVLQWSMHRLHTI